MNVMLDFFYLDKYILLIKIGDNANVKFPEKHLEFGMISPYIGVLLPYMGIFSPYMGIFSPYMGVLSPYMGTFKIRKLFNKFFTVIIFAINSC